MKKTVIKITLISLILWGFTTYVLTMGPRPPLPDWKTITVNSTTVHLYVPKTEPKLAGKRALMINLHGCAQKGKDLVEYGNWESTADKYGMVVAMPEVPGGGVIWGCWDYYGSNQTRDNKYNDHLLDVVDNLQSDGALNIDPNQVYISGLSSGGGEAGVMGCLSPDIFAGMGINAGPAIGTESGEISSVRTTKEEVVKLCNDFADPNNPYFETQLTSVVCGNQDYIVAQDYGKLIAEAMAEIYGATEKYDFDISGLEGESPKGNGTLWSDHDGPRVSLIGVSGMGHAWPAGSSPTCTTTNYIYLCNLNYPAYVTDFFFENNRRVN